MERLGEFPNCARRFPTKSFFLTSGVATSSTSPLNAFDAAVAKARISQCNLVNVSSIPPRDAFQIQNAAITLGAVTFTVMARMEGDSGETIGARVG